MWLRAIGYVGGFSIKSKVEADIGRAIDLQLDPHKAVELEVDAAVRRWRWMRIAKHIGDVDVEAAGEVMQPISRLLKSRQYDEVLNKQQKFVK